jgi:uncharacterized protein YfeS
MPKMLIETTWDEVKRSLQQQLKSLARSQQMGLRTLVMLGKKSRVCVALLAC